MSFSVVLPGADYLVLLHSSFKFNVAVSFVLFSELAYQWFSLLFEFRQYRGGNLINFVIQLGDEEEETRRCSRA